MTSYMNVPPWRDGRLSQTINKYCRTWRRLIGNPWTGMHIFSSSIYEKQIFHSLQGRVSGLNMSTKTFGQAPFVILILLLNSLSKCNFKIMKWCDLKGEIYCKFMFQCCYTVSETQRSDSKMSSKLIIKPADSDEHMMLVEDKIHKIQEKESFEEYLTKCQLDSNASLHTDFKRWLTYLKQSYLDIFPIDKDNSNHVRQVRNALFSIVNPTHFVSQVQLAVVSDAALSHCLDLSPTVIKSTLFLDFTSGNNQSGLFPPSLAHRYGGHQFGYWSGQLGDGRALLLGIFTNNRGDYWELQLKGSGLTPYSRTGDGRAVLRSSIREFLASEAMYFLGVRTSRAVSLVVSNDYVMRDQFYDGHPVPERAAIVLRMAPSWFRIGSLEILAQSGESDLLRLLLDHIISTHHKTIDLNDPDKYLHLFQSVVESTAEMIAKWQSVGFTHGVGNTDNFSLLSITIDYGPFGFLDHYNPKYVPNTSDEEGRYNYENQPQIGYYNLEKLLFSVESLFEKSQYKSAQIILNGYFEIYKDKFVKFFTKKLGLSSIHQVEDENFVVMFLNILEESGADFTMTFRQLGETHFDKLEKEKFNENGWALNKISQHSLYQDFLKLYKSRLDSEGTTDGQRQKIMNAHNPRYILRNWMAQKAIASAEEDDFTQLQKIYKILKSPFTYQQEAEDFGYAREPPSWASHIKVSCSS